MAKPYSIDIRERVVSVVEEGAQFNNYLVNSGYAST